MFISYSDTSGSRHESPFMVTAGLVATEADWVEFEQEWEAALNGELPYIHMKKFVPYARDHPDEAAALVSRCAEAIRRRVVRIVVRGLRVDAFKRVNETYCLQEAYGNPLSCVVGMTVMSGARWIEDQFPQEDARHYHERGESGWTPCIEILHAAGVTLNTEDAFNEKTGKWLASFQAADLISWPYRRVVADKLGKWGQPGPRAADWLKRLGTILQPDATALEESGLIAQCEQNPDLFPRRLHGDGVTDDTAAVQWYIDHDMPLPEPKRGKGYLVQPIRLRFLGIELA